MDKESGNMGLYFYNLDPWYTVKQVYIPPKSFQKYVWKMLRFETFFEEYFQVF
jgi:hypothetical protein